MRRTMRKRLLAIIATFAMVVAMMPSMVFGASNVAKIGDTVYATLQEARLALLKLSLIMQH